MLDALFTICFSPSTTTDRSIMETGALFIIFTFHLQDPEYIFGEWISEHICLNIENPEKQPLFEPRIFP